MIGNVHSSRDTMNMLMSGAKENAVATPEEFSACVSSLKDNAESTSAGKMLGMTWLPHTDGVSYGARAVYSEASTEDDPIVLVKTYLGNEECVHEIHVKEVNPANCTQLEMFALCCYTDDVGITERGSFGSYSKMKVFARNAYDNGYGGVNFEDLEQISIRLNWTDLLRQIAADYFGNASTYAQGIEAKSLAQSLAEWTKLLKRVDAGIRANR